MKSLLIIALISLALYSCNIFNSNPKDDPEPEIAFLNLEASNLYTVVGSEIPIEFNVSGKLDNGFISQQVEYSLFVNDQQATNKLFFSSNAAGFYSVYAQSAEIRSDTLQIEVRKAVQYEPKEFNVIFHIVHDGEDVGEGYNIPKERIDYQMNLLEAVFENERLSFSTNSVHPAMFFKLAHVGPQGNTLSEKGINRVQRPSQDHSILFEDWMWDHYWDPDYYINVWVGDTKNGYSWGIYPDLKCDSNLAGLACNDEEKVLTLQGIALELDNLWEGNWVFPHEMGHLFGLFHIFAPWGCESDADLANDTHSYDRALYEANITDHKRISCEGNEFISYNIMDYWSQPQDGRDLTFDQVERMRYVAERGRFRASKDPESGSPAIITKPVETKQPRKIE